MSYVIPMMDRTAYRWSARNVRHVSRPDMNTRRRLADPTQSPMTPMIFDQTNEPGPLLRRCHQRSSDIYSARTGVGAPTRQQLAILLAIHQLDRPTQARISARTGADRNTIAEVIRRLSARGLVEKRPSPDDSRASELELTAEGTAMVEAMLPQVRAVQAEILAPLPPELRSTFLLCLRIVAGVEKLESI